MNQTGNEEEATRDVTTGRFFTAMLEEYKIRLDAIERGRARAMGLLPVLTLTALGFAMWFFGIMGSVHTAAAVLAVISLAVFTTGAVMLVTAASHKGLVRADVNALLKAAKLDDIEASTAMADIYIDRINDLDRMVERQEGHFRAGAWLAFGFAALAALALLLQLVTAA